MPIFGICRGAQLMNIALGGTLDLHIPDIHPQAIAHRQADGAPILHPVDITPDTRLASILNVDSCEISSQHHQSLKEVAPNFKVAASASDGIIEAIEDPSYPWLIGVQWHPEQTAARDPIQQRLFDNFVAYVKETK